MTLSRQQRHHLAACARYNAGKNKPLERRDLMPSDATEWAVTNGIRPLNKSIHALHPNHAKTIFLERLVGICSVK